MSKKNRIKREMTKLGEAEYQRGYAAGLAAGNCSTLVSIRNWLTDLADNAKMRFPNLENESAQYRDDIIKFLRMLATVPAKSLDKLGYKDPAEEPRTVHGG